MKSKIPMTFAALTIGSILFATENGKIRKPSSEYPPAVVASADKIKDEDVKVIQSKTSELAEIRVKKVHYHRIKQKIVTWWDIETKVPPGDPASIKAENSSYDLEEINNGGENPCIPDGKSYTMHLKIRTTSTDQGKVFYDWVRVKSVNIAPNGEVTEICAE